MKGYPAGPASLIERAAPPQVRVSGIAAIVGDPGCTVLQGQRCVVGVRHVVGGSGGGLAELDENLTMLGGGAVQVKSLRARTCRRMAASRATGRTRTNFVLLAAALIS